MPFGGAVLAGDSRPHIGRVRAEFFGDLDGGLALWQRARCVAVEMELAALLVIAAQHGARAGGVFAIDGNPLAKKDTDMSGYDPFREVVARAVAATLTVALDALVSA